MYVGVENALSVCRGPEFIKASKQEKEKRERFLCWLNFVWFWPPSKCSDF